jgi:hypothetical protein
MLLIIVCGALLAVAIALTVRWGGEAVVEPAFPEDTGGRGRVHRDGLRYFVWWASVFTMIGTATGVAVLGAGGRLAMRLLAATSPQATGRLTEADAIVGDITVMGTLGFVVFSALPFAFVSGGLYLLAAPWLPPGRWAGPTFGAILLVTVAPFLDPLRADNIDFDRVGPGWLSVAVFAALAILQGAALAAVAGRLSRSLPLMTRRNWPRTGALLLPAIVLFPVGVVLAVGALVTAAIPRLLPWFLRVRSSRVGVVVGRIVLGLAVLAALPAFVLAVMSIAGR